MKLIKKIKKNIRKHILKAQKNVHVQGLEKNQYHQNVHTPTKATDRFNVIPIKIPVTFFSNPEKEKEILNT